MRRSGSGQAGGGRFGRRGETVDRRIVQHAVDPGIGIKMQNIRQCACLGFCGFAVGHHAQRIVQPITQEKDSLALSTSSTGLRHQGTIKILTFT